MNDINMTNEEIFKKIESARELIIVHIKPDLEPRLYEVASNTIYNMPVGYMEYDKKRYWRSV